MHPVIQLGPLALRSWAICVIAGVLLSWVLLLLRTTRLGYPPKLIFIWVLLAFPVGALGGSVLARLVAATGLVASNAQLTVLGTTLACLGFSWAFVRLVFKEGPGKLLDALAFTYGLSLASGRVGCLLHGCCQGGVAGDWVSGTPLAVLTIAPETLSPVIEHPTLVAGQRIWNLPVILLLLALVSLGVAEVLYRNKAKLALSHGTAAAGAIGVDSTGRFFAEFLREERRLPVLGVNPWQAIVLVLAVVATGWVARDLLRRREPAAAPVETAS